MRSLRRQHVGTVARDEPEGVAAGIALGETLRAVARATEGAAELTQQARRTGTVHHA